MSAKCEHGGSSNVLPCASKNLDEAMRDGRLIRSLPCKTLRQMLMSAPASRSCLQHADAVRAVEVAERLRVNLEIPR
jgi:hypothetical protein